ETARTLLAAISVGDDPKMVIRAADDALFPNLLETYIAERLPGQRKAPVVTKDLRREFGTPWRNKRIDEIEPSDVADIIRAIGRRGATAQARNMLAYVRPLFGWAVATGRLKHSPCATIKPSALLGENRATRERTLTDDELGKLWHRVEAMEYPYTPVYRLLIL